MNGRGGRGGLRHPDGRHPGGRDGVEGGDGGVGRRPGSRLRREGRLSPERASLHPSAHMLVNSMGASQRPRPEIGGITDPCAEDSFLLCSDGLWAYFEPAELADIIVSNSCREAATLLIDGARRRARGRGDNCSLVLIRLNRET